MAIRASMPGEGASPIQVRAQVLRQPQSAEAAGSLPAFPAMTDGEAGAGKTKAAQRKARWKQADLKRAIGAAEQAGLDNYRVEVAPDGTITIVVGDPANTAAPDGG